MKKSVFAATFLVVNLLFSIGCVAETQINYGVDISNPVVRATPPGIKNTAVFFTIKNTTNNDQLIVSAQASAGEKVELHTHSMVNGVMSMRQVMSVPLSAGEEVLFQPGGLHIMLFNVKKPLVVGDKVDITLLLDNGEKVKFVADVSMPNLPKD